MIKTIGLSKIFRTENVQTTALNEVNIEINRGEFVAIMGPSGCGKSTLLNILGLLDNPTSGELWFLGQEVSRFSENSRTDLRNGNIGFVFQSFNLIDELTVFENVELPLLYAEVPVRERVERVNCALERMQIAHRTEHYPQQLSGGQQQRVAIARAIVNEPKVLLLDEPLGALDLKMRQDMQYELIRLKNELGITFVFVTHDQEEALTISDTIVVMNQGYIQQIGTPEMIYNEPVNAFVADFIGDSNIINGTMIQDKVVEILGVKIPCVDEGFGCNTPVDVVIRPEDVVLGEEGQGILDGVVTSLIFKGVHYEMEVEANGYEWLVHSTNCHPVGSKVSISVIPFNIQIMHKPESEDEKAVTIDE